MLHSMSITDIQFLLNLKIFLTVLPFKTITLTIKYWGNYEA